MKQGSSPTRPDGRIDFHMQGAVNRRDQVGPVHKKDLNQCRFSFLFSGREEDSEDFFQTKLIFSNCFIRGRS